MERLASLLDAVRGVRASLPDKRRGLNHHYTMADIGMAAFSVFFMQCPSFLAHQRSLLEGQGRSNSQTLFDMTEIPSDNHIRDMLDPVDPSLFHPLFDKAVATLDESGGLDALRCLKGPSLEGPAFKGHILIALDGTEYHRSTKVRCARCSTLTKGTKTDYFHAMAQAAIVEPCRATIMVAGHRQLNWPIGPPSRSVYRGTDVIAVWQYKSEAAITIIVARAGFSG